VSDGGRFQRTERVFLAVADLDHATRAARLDELCEGDAKLRADVESLLRHHDSVARALDAPPPASPIPAPDRIGPYRILSVLGEGGMGTVYLAEQASPRRSVALKVVRPGLATRDTIRRFEREAEILGRLHHPGIAQIYEAGTADWGHGPQPYFAMEKIEGETIVEHAASHRLDRRARLDLLARACDAVHHAHLRGVVHCDLKPGNVLVDVTGQPKILDFGVARAVSGEAAAATLRTDSTGKLLGTLPYMSPEQASGDPDTLDPPSDVYALGVMLYELLSGGKLPLEFARLPLPEAARVIAEREPLPLSRHDRSLRGDIETIAAKALEKDRRRRYASAADLASDVRAHLEDRPIAARQPTAIEQLRKFSRRHRALAAGLLAGLAALVVGLGGTLWQWSKAVRERNLAMLLEEDATLTALFFQSFVESVDPAKDGRDVTFLELLDRNAGQAVGAFRGKPHLEARVRHSIGDAYRKLGRIDAAESHLVAAAEIARAEPDVDPEERAVVILDLGALRHAQGRYDEAEALWREAIASAPDGESSEAALRAKSALGALLSTRGRFEEAMRVLTEAIESRKSLSGGGDDQHLSAINNLATILVRTDRFEEARALLEKTVESFESARGPFDPQTIQARSNLGVALLEGGDAAAAAPILEDAFARQLDILGPDHLHTLLTRSNLAVLRKAQGRLAEAEELAGTAAEKLSSNFGDRHEASAAALEILGLVLRDLRRPAEALPILERAFAAKRAICGADHPLTFSSMANLGLVHLDLRDLDRSAELLEPAVEGLEKSFGPRHPLAIQALVNLASLETERRNFEKSASLFARALDTLREKGKPATSAECVLVYNYARLLSDMGRASEALPVFEESVAAGGKLGPPFAPALALFRGGLGECLLDVGRPADAEPHLRAHHEFVINALANDATRVRRSYERLARLCEMTGKEDEAARCRAALASMTD